jgi:hypothetical protein
MNDMNTYSHSRLIKQPNQYSMFAANWMRQDSDENSKDLQLVVDSLEKRG